MKQRTASFLSWLQFPYYAYVGIRLRNSIMRLSPAHGPRYGRVGTLPDGASVAPIRILALGDSSAAAVGIEHTSGALAPQLAAMVNERKGEAVDWHISGHNSATCGSILDAVVPNLPHDLDPTHVVLQIGMNDMKNWHSGRRFCREFGHLLYAVRARFPEAKIFWSQGIDATKVPAMPERLGRIANLRRIIINERGTQLCVERGVVALAPLPGVTDDGFCRDGFHAGEKGYAAWAEHVMNHWDMNPREAPAARPYI